MDREYFDVLDSTGAKTGQVVARDEAHRNGVWHGAFHCLIVGERDGRAYALFQKRSSEKKIAPGKFDVSVGGHYAAGEDAAVAGPREIKEELGLDVRFEDLLPLGRRIFVYGFTPGVREYEFQDVFLLPRTVSAQGLALQREEVEGVAEVEVGDGISLFAGAAGEIALTLWRSDGSRVPCWATVESFVPNLDNYYLKLLLLARRYVSGERELLFI
jgi:isopentenyldiphosphate isomerase